MGSVEALYDDQDIEDRMRRRHSRHITPDQPPFDPPKMNPIPEWRIDKKDCRRCGKIIGLSDKYCKFCGNLCLD